MSVRETSTITIEYNPVSGRKMLNRYEIYGELGRGQHGKVKLGKDPAQDTFVAIKTVDRKTRPRLGRPSTSTSEAKVRQEIAILKKCKHPNIVELLEVLDDSSSRKIYLVLEYLEKGEVKWQTNDMKPALDLDRARKVFVDTLMGLEYLHAHGIIHRDIKPANLLLSGDDVVKISDFGVSYAYTSQDCDELEMAKTVGSPAFFAPEMCIFDDNTTPKPRMTKKIDVWALGVTLFCLVYGTLPFDADNEYELFRVISTQPLQLPSTNPKYAQVNDMLSRLLEKDPEKRIDTPEIRSHPWLQMEGLFVPAQPARTSVSEDEINHAVRGIASRIKSSFSRFVRSRSGSRSRGDTDVSVGELRRGSGTSNTTGAGEKSVSRSAPAPIPAPVPVSAAPTSEPVSRAPSVPAHLPHIASSPGRINLPTNVYNQPRYPSQDTLNHVEPSSSNSSSGSDSDSDGQLTFVIGRKR